MDEIMKIGELPRAKLSSWPTPFERLTNLSKHLGGPNIFIKRDDLISLAFGGTKTRGLECVFADALAKRADTIITVCSLHGNLSTQVAAAARKLGMQAIIIARDPTGYYPPHVLDGNLLLKRILGAVIEPVTGEKNTESGRAAATERAQKIGEELKEEGRKPYLVVENNPLWAAGIANAIPELVSQSEEEDIDIGYLVHTSAYGATQAGLVLGATALETGIKVIGIANGYEPKRVVSSRIAEIANASAQLLGLNFSTSAEAITLLDDYVGEGYGTIDQFTLDTVKLVAETEGIFLDPVYTARGMLGLVNLIRTRYFKREDNVVFIHTGGLPSLFGYREPLTAMLASREPLWTKPAWIR
jgi:L-cysteate sulfo-lyase